MSFSELNVPFAPPYNVTALEMDTAVNQALMSSGGLEALWQLL